MVRLGVLRHEVRPAGAGFVSADTPELMQSMADSIGECWLTTLVRRFVLSSRGLGARLPRIVGRTPICPPREPSESRISALILAGSAHRVGDLPVGHDPDGWALLPQQLDWPPDQFGGQFQLSAELRGSRTSRARQTQTCRDRACRVVAPAASVIESGSCGS